MTQQVRLIGIRLAVWWNRQATGCCAEWSVGERAQANLRQIAKLMYHRDDCVGTQWLALCNGLIDVCGSKLKMVGWRSFTHMGSIEDNEKMRDIGFIALCILFTSLVVKSQINSCFLYILFTSLVF